MRINFERKKSEDGSKFGSLQFMKNILQGSQNNQSSQLLSEYERQTRPLYEAKQTKFLEEFMLILFLTVKCLTFLPPHDKKARRIKKLFLSELNHLKRQSIIEQLSQKSVLKQIQIMTARKQYLTRTRVQVRCESQVSFEIEKICQIFNDRFRLKRDFERMKVKKVSLFQKLTQFSQQEWAKLWGGQFQVCTKQQLIEWRLNVKVIIKFANINQDHSNQSS